MRTVVAAWANIDAFPRGSNMRVWLFRMLRTVYYADPQPTGRAANDFGALGDRLAPRTNPVANCAETRFLRAFNALPVGQREALVLTGPEGLSLRDAATVCGCSPAKIGSRVKLGHRRLAVVLSMDAGGAEPVGDPVSLEMICRRALSGSLSTHNAGLGGHTFQLPGAVPLAECLGNPGHGRPLRGALGARVVERRRQLRACRCPIGLNAAFLARSS
jgi:hypothetical protein